MNLCSILSITTTGCSMCRLSNCSLIWAGSKSFNPFSTLWNYVLSIHRLLCGCLICSNMSAQISLIKKLQSTSKPKHLRPLMTPRIANNFLFWWRVAWSVDVCNSNAVSGVAWSLPTWYFVRWPAQMRGQRFTYNAWSSNNNGYMVGTLSNF